MTNGYYVYGLMRTDRDIDLGCIGLDVNGEPGRVFTVRADSVAAVVSELVLATGGESSAGARVPPLLANMRPYHTVLCEVMKTTTIAPMKFGHVAASQDALREGLRDNRARIEELLDRLEDKVEMGLQIKWAGDDVFARFVEMDPELREARDQVFGSPQEPAFEDRFALGEMFAERMAVHREEQRRRLEEKLQPCCREIKALDPRNDGTVAELAFLVDREGVGAFTERVHQTAGEFPAEYVFGFSGPLAPFNFVDPGL